MPYLTDLPDIVAATGLKVHVVPGALSRGQGPMTGRPRGVVCHHTGDGPGIFPSVKVVTYGRSDLKGLLAQLGLARDGSVYVAGCGLAYHAGIGAGYGLPRNFANPYMVGIEAESHGTGDWTPAQHAAYPILAGGLAKGYHFSPDMIIGHKEWAQPPGRKIDPHKFPGDMAAIRAGARRYLAGKGVTLPASRSPLDDLTDEELDMASDATIQKIAKAVADEVWSRQIVKGMNAAQALGRIASWSSKAAAVAHSAAASSAAVLQHKILDDERFKPVERDVADVLGSLYTWVPRILASVESQTGQKVPTKKES